MSTKKGESYMNSCRFTMSLALCAACFTVFGAGAKPAAQTLFKNGDEVQGVKSAVYRIPALCTAPNGDLVVACDARRDGGGED